MTREDIGFLISSRIKDVRNVLRCCDWVNILKKRTQVSQTNNRKRNLKNASPGKDKSKWREPMLLTCDTREIFHCILFFVMLFSACFFLIVLAPLLLPQSVDCHPIIGETFPPTMTQEDDDLNIVYPESSMEGKQLLHRTRRNFVDANHPEFLSHSPSQSPLKQPFESEFSKTFVIQSTGVRKVLSKE